MSAENAAEPREGPVTRVLVVDDDPNINRLVRARLAARGFLVESASDGSEALARLSETVPDLMFCDVSMPGIETSQKIRSGTLSANRSSASPPSAAAST